MKVILRANSKDVPVVELPAQTIKKDFVLVYFYEHANGKKSFRLTTQFDSFPQMCRVVAAEIAITKKCEIAHTIFAFERGKNKGYKDITADVEDWLFF